MDCSLPGSSVHGISQARILEWVAISLSRGSSPTRDRTSVFCIGRRIIYHWVTWEAHRNAYMYVIRVILKAHKQTRWTESKALKLSLWPVSVLRGEEGAKQGRSQLQLLLCPPVATLSPCSLLAMMWVLNSLMPMMVLQLIPFVKVKCTNLKCLGMFLDSLFGTYLTEGKRTANSCHYSQSPMRAGIKNFFSRKTDFKAVD